MQGFHAGGVVFVRAGQNGNQRAGIHQHAALHFDFPKPSK